jgi:hypothetical protein
MIYIIGNPMLDRRSEYFSRDPERYCMGKMYVDTQDEHDGGEERAEETIGDLVPDEERYMDGSTKTSIRRTCLTSSTRSALLANTCTRTQHRPRNE